MPEKRDYSTRPVAQSFRKRKEKPLVLCVDDEPGILEGLRLTLRRHFRVYTAEGGEEGLELLRTKGPFAVVISDMRMPKMNGAEFLSAVRVVSPDTVRILLTGYADVTSAIRAVNEGQISRFLTKPCPPNELITVITEAVGRYKSTTSERAIFEELYSKMMNNSSS